MSGAIQKMGMDLRRKKKNRTQKWENTKKK